MGKMQDDLQEEDIDLQEEDIDLQEEDIDLQGEDINLQEEDIDLKEEEIEYMDLENEDFQADEQEIWDDNWQDEPEPVKPWAIALIFVGLAVLAAVICAILWRFTHNEVQEPKTGDATVTESPKPSEAGGPTTAPEDQTSAPMDEIHGDGEAGEGDGSDTAQMEDPSAEPGGRQESENPPESNNEPENPPVSWQTEEPSVPQEPEDGDTGMRFNAVQDAVTPKDVVNLRSVPSTSDENTVVVQASNGEVLARVGVNPETGWSQIDYNGQTLYAVSRYLTTDLNYKTPVQPSDPNRVSTISGRVIIFTDCDDNMTPKEYVNLRTEPSTTEGDATVRCQVSSGETVHRTGYSADSGWSRVEYNGEILYVVTSLMLVQ